jgi:Tol biopolymer transport system component
MKTLTKTALMLILLLAFTITLSAQQSETNLPKLTGPFLGQKIPRKTAEPFAVDFLDTRFRTFHGGIIFSPDGKEAYWHGMQNDETRILGIWESKIKDGYWTEPKIAPFSIYTSDFIDDSPFMSPDGDKIYFLSKRPVEKNGKSDKWNIWFVNREKEGWSDPLLLTPIIDSTYNLYWRFSLDGKGNLYFGSQKEAGRFSGDIYLSKFENGQYTKPEKLGSEINQTGGYNFSPFIAKDGSYLLFIRDIRDIQDIKLFCSYRKKDGSWTEAKNISNLIEPGKDNPIVTPDGKFLFLRGFKNNRQQTLYWMDTSFIEDLRKEALKDDK